MEEEISQSSETQQPFGETSRPVSLKRKERRFSKKKITVVAMMLVALGLIFGGILYLIRGNNPQEEDAWPTPEVSLGVATSSPEELEPSPTPEAVKREEVKIQILNGTGIAKEASYLEGELKSLGYSQVEVGNSDKQDYENTQVTFSKLLAENLVDEISKELEKIYQKVEVKKISTSTFDVKVVTGLRKGVTPRPSPTQTPVSSPSPTSTPTSSPTLSPSPTAPS